MPSSTFRLALDDGWRRTPKIQRGGSVNTWGSRMNELAQKLDACEMSPEVQALVREVFEESAYLLSSAFDR